MVVTGPSPLQTKSTGSSRRVCSGKAETCPPTMRIGVSGRNLFYRRANLARANHLLRRGGRLVSKHHHRHQTRLQLMTRSATRAGGMLSASESRIAIW